MRSSIGKDGQGVGLRILTKTSKYICRMIFKRQVRPLCLDRQKDRQKDGQTDGQTERMGMCPRPI